MIERLDRSRGKILGFKLSGKLHDDDYQHFVPAVDAIIVLYGSVRVLALFEDFHGWDLHAFWDDLKFTAKHFNALERIALVGDDDGREDWMRLICKPLTHAEVRYFTHAQLNEAWRWIEEAGSVSKQH
jgi:hypothetical protein